MSTCSRWQLAQTRESQAEGVLGYRLRVGTLGAGPGDAAGLRQREEPRFSDPLNSGHGELNPPQIRVRGKHTEQSLNVLRRGPDKSVCLLALRGHSPASLDHRLQGKTR